jgi:hypothetical protein
MKFIIVDNKSGKHRSFNANAFIFGVALIGLISIPTAAGYYAYQFGVGEAALTGEVVAKWREVLGEQQDTIETTKGNAEHTLVAYALRLLNFKQELFVLTHWVKD